MCEVPLNFYDLGIQVISKPFKPQPSSRNPQTSHLNPQPSPLTPQPSTLKPLSSSSLLSSLELSDTRVYEP